MIVFDVAPLDGYAQRVTSGVAYVGGVLMLPILFAYLGNVRWYGLFLPAAFAFLLAVFLLLTYAAQPISYRVEQSHLVVRRRWMRPLSLPLAGIIGVSLASSLAGVPHAGFRFTFNPGVFGYQGPFHLEPFGAVFFLATNREKLIAVGRRGDVPLILSPMQPRAFIDALREKTTPTPPPIPTDETESPETIL